MEGGWEGEGGEHCVSIMFVVQPGRNVTNIEKWHGQKFYSWPFLALVSLRWCLHGHERLPAMLRFRLVD